VAIGTFAGDLILADAVNNGSKSTTVKVHKPGISQLLWSDDAHYIYCIGREADSVSVFDVRGQKISHRLIGFAGETKQRIFGATSGNHLYVGGSDGTIRQWTNQDIQPSLIIPANQDADIITCVDVNPAYPPMVLSCSAGNEPGVKLWHIQT
jgi:WD40 repeat protein